MCKSPQGTGLSFLPVNAADTASETDGGWFEDSEKRYSTEVIYGGSNKYYNFGDDKAQEAGTCSREVKWQNSEIESCNSNG